MMDYETFKRKFLGEKFIDNESLPYSLFGFIKYYEIKDNNLVIYFNDKTIITPYSRQIEVEILDKMKSQFKYYEKLCRDDLESKKYNLTCGSIYLFNSIFQFSLVFINNSPFFLISAGTWLAASIIWYMPYYKAFVKDRDLKKHTLFLEHEDEINKLIVENMLKYGIVNEESINLAPKFSSYATINDVHFMSKQEVQDLTNGNVSEEMIYKLRKDR